MTMSRRFFNAAERFAMHANAGGRCQSCGAELQPGWHADHKTPYSKSGHTDIANAQALCDRCNLSKGSRTIMTHLRPWQQEALEQYLDASKQDFLAVACPGAGKTTWALTVAKTLLDRGTVGRVIVVVPSDALRTQWSDHTGAGVNLRPFVTGEEVDKAGYHGIVTTYQAIANGMAAHQMRQAIGEQDTRRTLVILDEIHHAADQSSFGRELQYAFQNASRRLSLTGTPWRTRSSERMPFVEFGDDDMLQVDYTYSYGHAVTDGVCRPMHFAFINGHAAWAGPDGREEADLDVNRTLSGVDASSAMRALLDASDTGGWIAAVLESAHRDLLSIRTEIPDAAGLIVARDRRHAQAIAAKLHQVTGVTAPVVVSGEDEGGGNAQARQTIERFRRSNEPWIIAVKMIAEGVDIPRLLVGVYATNVSTAMFFNQVVGRFVRVRPGERATARMYTAPSMELNALVQEIRDMLPQQLTEAAEVSDRERSGAGSSGPREFTALGSEDRGLSLVQTAEGGVQGTLVRDWESFLTSQGVPSHYATNLASTGTAAPYVQPADEVPLHRQEARLRREIDTLSGRVAYICYSGPADKKAVASDLWKVFGKSRKDMTLDELGAAKELLLESIGTGARLWPTAS